MKRVPEPELMNDKAQARAYAEADFSEPHDMFLELFRATFPEEDITGDVVDLGCGPADITLRFARTYTRCRLHGVDGAESMLALGRKAVVQTGMTERVRLVHGVLPGSGLPRKKYQAVICNSLLHHLQDPMVLWATVNEYTDTGAPVFIMDLLRPDRSEQLDALVITYARGAPAILRHDFRCSLFAAYRVDEVRAQLKAANLDYMQVRVVSDRHLTVAGRFRG